MARRGWPVTRPVRHVGVLSVDHIPVELLNSGRWSASLRTVRRGSRPGCDLADRATRSHNPVPARGRDDLRCRHRHVYDIAALAHTDTRLRQRSHAAEPEPGPREALTARRPGLTRCAKPARRWPGHRSRYSPVTRRVGSCGSYQCDATPLRWVIPASRWTIDKPCRIRADENASDHLGTIALVPSQLEGASVKNTRPHRHALGKTFRSQN